MTQRGQQDIKNYCSYDKCIVAKQALRQTLKDKLRQAREESAPPNVITDLGKSHAKEKHELLKLQHQARQKTVTDAIDSSSTQPKTTKNLIPFHVEIAWTIQNRSRAV
jgi:hypothetical protein